MTFIFFITNINEEGSSSESDEIVTPPLKCARTRGVATVVGRACTRGGATVGRVCNRGGATVSRAHACGGATVGRAHTRGGATVGRAHACGGATVGKVHARGAVGQNRGGVRRNGRGGRIGNPLSQWEKIEKEEKVNFKDFQNHEIGGCNYRMKEDSTCLDFLELYLTDEIMTLIVNETNRYAEQFLAANIISAQNSYLSSWEVTTVPEMKTFIECNSLDGDNL